MTRKLAEVCDCVTVMAVTLAGKVRCGSNVTVMASVRVLVHIPTSR